MIDESSLTSNASTEQLLCLMSSLASLCTGVSCIELPCLVTVEEEVRGHACHPLGGNGSCKRELKKKNNVRQKGMGFGVLSASEIFVFGL